MHFDKHYLITHIADAIAHDLLANDSGDLQGKLKRTNEHSRMNFQVSEEKFADHNVFIFGKFVEFQSH